ncbi:MAG: CAF17-like 4Fe-4S cluster assembly/insertion protein YgfZ [Gammaproteobacteria bacterium]
MIIDQPSPVTANTRHQLGHLAALTVSGDDAAQFLQGQLTCDIKALTETKASIAAYCTPKGRVITTLLAIKVPSGFLLIVPRSLAEKVFKRLQMYILRSNVHLADQTAALALTGVHCICAIQEVPSIDFACRQQNGYITIKLPSKTPRYLSITPNDQPVDPLFTDFAEGNEQQWRYADISSGLPWFELDQSEKYIPQMLNLDRLGGVSFNKGCYTGQEIVARTHYLGEAKRHLYLAQCEGKLHADAFPPVHNAQTREKIGEILTYETAANDTRLLLVLQSVDSETKSLILGDAAQTPLTLIPFQ